MNNETDFKALFMRSFRDCDPVRIETTTTRGAPDVNMCRNSMEVWAELKITHAGRVLLRPEQYAWGMRRSTAGGRVFVVAMIIETGTVMVWKYPAIDWEPYGKYLWIKSPPAQVYSGDPNLKELKTFMFT